MILDKFRLEGKTAVVTGGTRGLGQAMARGLAQAGADLVLVSRSPNPAFQAEIEGLGRRCLHHRADLTDRAETKRVIPELARRIARIDILINDAGICPRTEVVDFSEEDWDRTLELNLSAAFILSQAAGREMIKAGGGRIINVASIMSFQGGIRVPSYAATKHGLAGLTKSLANAWAGKGVHVNAIAPGFFETDLTEPLVNDPVRSEGILGRVPAGRFGRPEELAGAAVFLASEASSFVHGTVISVDGGWLSW